MSTKLLIAGVVLTVLAVKTDQANRSKVIEEPAAMSLDAGLHDSSILKQGFTLLGGVFEGGLAKATEQSLANSQNTLTLLEPHIERTGGANGQNARKLVREARVAIEKANAKLAEGKTFVALDYAIQASSRTGDLRKQFERR